MTTEKRESSCVQFLESMKEKIELMMKAGDISDDFSRHSLMTKRRKNQMNPEKLADYKRIRKDCEEGGMTLGEACRKHGYSSSRVHSHAYDNGWDIMEFKTKKRQYTDAECKRLHDFIVFNNCTIQSAVDDFDVTERQYVSWKARQRSINAEKNK